MSAFLLIMGISFLLGLAAGILMQRADFCMTAAFRDLFLFRSTTLLAALLILVTASAILFEAVRLVGGFVRFPFPAFGPPNLVALLGGGLFGIGMVLAGGCVVGLLYRLGAGSRLSLWGIAGLIAGSALYAETHPFWSELSKKTALSRQAITLPQLLGMPSWPLVLGLAVVTGLLIWRKAARFAPLPGWQEVSGYIPPLYAALALAGVGTLSAILLGMPLGVTTSYVKMAALLERLVVPEHQAATAFFQLTPLNLTLPLAAQPLRGGPGPGFDGIAVIQYPLILGIILGSAGSARALGEWRWSRGTTWRQTLSVLCGGLLMGLASRLASGCNIWHLWGGLPIFSGQSLLFLFGLFPGAWLGGRMLLRWVVPEDSQGGVQ